MAAFDSIDSWFEKGFRVRKTNGARTARRDAVRARSGASPRSAGGVKLSAQAKASNIKSVIRKAPEVVVKITGSSSGLATVQRHLAYIARDGEVELTTEADEKVRGLGELKDLRDRLAAAKIPEEGHKREFLHVMFSMPAGTPEQPVRDAVAAFCKEEFANRRYVMAFHDDTDHTHMHVCVGTRDIDRADEPRLAPRKADLFRWRQGFADKLRDNGIDAAASERWHRFNYRKAEHPVVRQIQADNPRSDAYNAPRAKERTLARAMKASMRPETAFVGPLRPPREAKVVLERRAAEAAALATATRLENPAHERLEATRQQAAQGWQQVANALARDGEAVLAKQARALLQAGESPVRSASQERFDAAMAQKPDDLSQER
ncbi:relaxase/mobilization nuclease domain-containing protein [Variovorax saccharolyticus]|uniref:relaxase/mobilization nuclease domain-containing protein n=1 Tax=Variovorax saccharolyticus TaxID=3053516 RepID=UPI002578D2D0|nr:relaxase/mobilization nuclease domain-containing protein [Variovorax sp. J31P216]MDM0029136.1 relaxase/mobilization nuclease domain-containing protein [Variovorax sp. J31P216]